jgi:Tfp pilus assembly protein FimT
MRGQRVVVCKSSNGATCVNPTDTANWARGWEQGWIVFVGLNNNTTNDANDDATADTGEEALRVHAELSGGFTLTGATNVISYISYSSDGRARLTNG